MADELPSDALLRGAGAVGVGAGVLALFPSLATTVSLTKVVMFARPGSDPVGVATIHQVGDGNPFETEEAATPTARDLGVFEAAVWLPSSGDAPGGDDWRWYGRLAGVYGATRHGRQQAALIVEDATRPVTPHHPRPRQTVRVLMRVDEPATGTGRLVTWWHETGAGQARYTDCDPGGSISDTLFTRWRLPGLRVVVRAVSPARAEQLIPQNRPDRVHSRDCERRSVRSHRCDETCSPRSR